jgi:ATPase subunit of ABC transporter with duplicated ATPase domains
MCFLLCLCSVTEKLWKLHSRVGIIGPNGAGKSTLIKLLTVGCHSMEPSWCADNAKGETIPQEGTVYKHPALRVGYVSQHATHHIGKRHSSVLIKSNKPPSQSIILRRHPLVIFSVRYI